MANSLRGLIDGPVDSENTSNDEEKITPRSNEETDQALTAVTEGIRNMAVPVVSGDRERENVRDEEHPLEATEGAKAQRPIYVTPERKSLDDHFFDGTEIVTISKVAENRIEALLKNPLAQMIYRLLSEAYYKNNGSDAVRDALWLNGVINEFTEELETICDSYLSTDAFINQISDNVRHILETSFFHNIELETFYDSLEQKAFPDIDNMHEVWHKIFYAIDAMSFPKGETLDIANVLLQANGRDVMNKKPEKIELIERILDEVLLDAVAENVRKQRHANSRVQQDSRFFKLMKILDEIFEDDSFLLSHAERKFTPNADRDTLMRELKELLQEETFVWSLTRQEQQGHTIAKHVDNDDGNGVEKMLERIHNNEFVSVSSMFFNEKIAQSAVLIALNRIDNMNKVLDWITDPRSIARTSLPTHMRIPIGRAIEYDENNMPIIKLTETIRPVLKQMRVRGTPQNQPRNYKVSLLTAYPQ